MNFHGFGQAVRVRKQVLQLVGALNRWCNVREDLLYGFQKCLDTGLEQPLKDVVEEFLTRVRGGMAQDQALDLMQQSLAHEHFQDFVAAVRFNLHYRGDLPSLLEHFEWQMNRIEEEYTRRKLSNARDFKITAAILVAVPLCSIIRLLGNSGQAIQIWQSGPGLVLLLIGSLFYLMSVLGFFLIRKKIND